MTEGAATEVATLAGGCFWCPEAIFKEVDGVEKVTSGYTGGTTTNPTYQEVCTGNTGHAEAVQLAFNPGKISYREILQIFFSIHDPTTANRQGGDVGIQYRSAIFYHDDRQRATAEALVRELDEARLWKNPIVTQVVPLENFYPAEDYHREYFLRHPEQSYCQVVISPKVDKFHKRWTDHIKRESTQAKLLPHQGDHRTLVLNAAQPAGQSILKRLLRSSPKHVPGGKHASLAAERLNIGAYMHHLPSIAAERIAGWARRQTGPKGL